MDFWLQILMDLFVLLEIAAIWMILKNPLMQRLPSVILVSNAVIAASMLFYLGDILFTKILVLCSVFSTLVAGLVFDITKSRQLGVLFAVISLVPIFALFLGYIATRFM